MRISAGSHDPNVRGPFRPRVLVVTDDEHVLKSLMRALTANGYRPRSCRRGDEVVLLQAEVDQILLDIDSIGDGWIDLLRRVRRYSQVPLLALTALRDERSVVTILCSGADDVLPKPLRMQELFARLWAVSRRAGRPTHTKIQVDDVRVDLDARLVEVATRPVRLAAKEFDVLATLARRHGQAVSNHRIAYDVWGDADRDRTNTLKVLVYRLRTKLARPELLQTVRGFGYRFGPAP